MNEPCINELNAALNHLINEPYSYEEFKLKWERLFHKFSIRNTTKERELVKNEHAEYKEGKNLENDNAYRAVSDLLRRFFYELTPGFAIAEFMKDQRNLKSSDLILQYAAYTIDPITGKERQNEGYDFIVKIGNKEYYIDCFSYLEDVDYFLERDRVRVGCSHAFYTDEDVTNDLICKLKNKIKKIKSKRSNQKDLSLIHCVM